jgi:uncharacterized membrane protein
MVQRALCLAAALGLLVLAQVNFGVAVSSPWRAQISPLGFLFALGLSVAACTVRTTRALNWVLLAIFSVAVALTATEAAGYLLGRRGFGIDEGAFVQYGTRLLLRGQNPYAHSLARALQLYGASPVPTALTNGSISTHFAYPSLSLLLSVPFYWLTNGVESVPVAAVFFQCVTAAMLFVILPSRLRPLAVIVVLELPLLFGYEVNGSFYSMFLPFALVAIWKWTDVGQAGRLSRADLVRAVCLGLACAVEQIVWAMALFLLVGIWRAGSRRLGNLGSARVTGRFALAATAAFAVVNLPFFVWGPGAWWSGVSAPFLQHAIPFGEGLVDLTLLLRAGGGNLDWYTDAAIALLAALLVAYAVWFRGLWRAGIILAGLMFFVSTRPLDGYWRELAPLWLAAVAVPGPDPDPAPLPWRSDGLHGLRVAWAAVLFAPVLAFSGLALTATAPLRLHIESVGIESALQEVWRVSVRATNETGSPVRPRFALNSGGQLSSYWPIASGPTVLAAGRTALYSLSSPNLQTSPSLTTPFVISAVSASPDAISTSQVFQAVDRILVLTPRQVDNPLRVGRTIVFRAQIENPVGVPLSVARVRVELMQQVFGQSHHLQPTASLNGQPAAKPVAYARTNARGVATFRVRDLVPTGTRSAPLFLRAWIPVMHSLPYGYSNTVEVKWYAPSSPVP